MLTVLYNSKDGGSVPYTVALSDYQVTNNGQLNLTGRIEYNCDKTHLLHMFESLAKVFLTSYNLQNALSEAKRNSTMNQAPANYSFGTVPPIATPTATTPNGSSITVQVEALAKRVDEMEKKIGTLATNVSSHNYTVDSLRGTNIVSRVSKLETTFNDVHSRVTNIEASEADRKTPARPASPAPTLSRVYGSSLIASRGYNPYTRQLTVELIPDGNLYQYEDVPLSVWRNFLDAGSAGSYYNANIKGRFTSTNLGRNNGTLTTR